MFDNDTIFERLAEAKRKWRVYHDGIAHVWVFPSLWLSLIFRRRFRSIDRFTKDVAKGDLPESAGEEDAPDNDASVVHEPEIS